MGRLSCILVFVLLAPCVAEVQRPVSLDLPATTVQEAVSTLFAQRPDLHYDLLTEVGDLQSAPITLKDTPFESALRAVLSRVDATFSVRDGCYVIRAVEPTKTEEAREGSAKPRRVVLYGRSRYEVEQALGEPEKIEYKRTPGNELWRYPDRVVEFVNCRVWRVNEPDTLSVNAGRTPPPAPRRDQNPGYGWVQGMRNYARILAASEPYDYAFSSISYSYFSSSTISYSVVSEPVSRPVMFNSQTGAPILWQ